MISDPPSARTGRQAELGVRWVQRGGRWAPFGPEGDTCLENVNAFLWWVAIRTEIRVFNEVEIGSKKVKLIKGRLGDDSESSNKPRGFIVVLGESFWRDNEAGVTKNINHFILLSVDKSLHFSGGRVSRREERDGSTASHFTLTRALWHHFYDTKQLIKT